MEDGSQQESSFSKGMKLTFGIVFAVFLVGMTLTCAMCGSCATCAGVMSNADQASKSSNSNGGSESSAPAAKTVKLGETFQLGEFSYMVTEVKTAKNLGNQFMKEEAGEGATFLIVYFTIRNDGKETATVMKDDFEIRDTQDRTFRSSSNANTALAMSNDDDFMISELQPGLQKTTATAFEVPEDVIANNFDIVVPEKGWTGSGSLAVAVKPDEVQ
jgi:hypothetical protein